MSLKTFFGHFGRFENNRVSNWPTGLWRAKWTGFDWMQSTGRAHQRELRSTRTCDGSYLLLVELRIFDLR